MTFSTKCRTAICAVAICTLATPAVALAGAQDLRMPDTRDVAQSYTPGDGAQDIRNPDTRDIAQGRDVTPAPAATQAAPAVPAYGGVDWASAALGAAIFGGLVLVVASATAVLRRTRTHVAG